MSIFIHCNFFVKLCDNFQVLIDYIELGNLT